MVSPAEAALIKRTVTYLDLVAAAVLSYDYLLTIRQEVNLVWGSPWNAGKVLFFLTRYPVFAETTLVLYHQFAVMSPQRCDLVFKTIGYQLGTGTLIAESILAVRTWVIWRRNKYVAVGLGVGIALTWTPVFYFLAQSLNSLVFEAPPVPHAPGCYLVSQKNILFVVFVLISSFETLILILTLYKCLGYLRQTKSALIKVLFRDGIMNYVYLFMLSFCNVTVLLTAPHGYSTLLSALQRVLHAILSGRILLHLREASVNRQGTGFETTRTNISVQLPHSPGRPKGKTVDTVASVLETATWFGDTERDDSSTVVQGLATIHS